MCIISACKSKPYIHGTKADMFPISALFSAQYREGRGRKEERKREDEKNGGKKEKGKGSNPGSWVSRRPCPPLSPRVVSCLFRRAVADEEIPRALTPTPRPTDGGKGVGGEPRLVEMPTAVTPSSGSLLLHLVST